MSVIRGTTPTFTFTIKSTTLDLTAMGHVYVKFQQGSETYVEMADEQLVVGAKTVSCYWTQEQSLKFVEGKAQVQINWTWPDPVDGTIRRAATKWKEILIDRQLLKRVLE